MGTREQADEPIYAALRALEAQYAPTLLNLHVYFRHTTRHIVLANLEVRRAERNEGRGSAFMQALCITADSLGLAIVLTPEPMPRKRTSLERFYKRFGFVRNKESYITETRIRRENVATRTKTR